MEFRLLLLVCASVMILFSSPACSPRPGVTEDGYASARVQTWHDVDGDGKRTPAESPLAWVTIQLAYESSITDSSGQGKVGIFKAGCMRRCWEGESVSVKVPPGYRATTPLALELMGQEQAYEFGFQLTETGPSVSFPGEPDWLQAFPNRGLELVDFHYVVENGRLTLSFDTAGDLNPDTIYRDVFDIVRTLKRIERIWVEWVEITIINLPAEDVAVCDMQVVEEWAGRLAPAEIVSTHCKGSR
ncbi:MAG: hypothetical protein JSV81_15755 [Anaerolineales bacterium]|nr:MAG: hypothetical protein JSV81_15755 [Anaerolineales bacterium]